MEFRRYLAMREASNLLSSAISHEANVFRTGFKVTGPQGNGTVASGNMSLRCTIIALWHQVTVSQKDINEAQCSNGE